MRTGVSLRYFIYNNKTSQFEDRTNDILPPRFDAGDKVTVFFKSKPSRPYHYAANRIAAVEETPRSVLPDRAYFHRGEELRGVSSITLLKSENPGFANRLEITSQEGVTLAKEDDVAAFEKAGTNRVFRYLKEIAALIDAPDSSSGETAGYLARQFHQACEGTLAGTAAGFLFGKSEKAQHPPTERRVPLLFPFGSNLSQMNAVEAAMTNTISAIEGPPGTGKTQTILNIIANLLYERKSVLVASPNNAATENVARKLTSEGLGFLVAELGRRDNTAAFVQNQQNLKAYPASLKEWRLSSEAKDKLEEAVSHDAENLRDGYRRQQALAANRMRLRNADLEYRLFSSQSTDGNPLRGASASVAHLRTVRDAISQHMRTGTKVPLSSRIQFSLFWRIGSWSDYGQPTIDLELRLNKLILKAEIDKLNRSIQEDASWLESHNIEQIAKRLAANSMTLLKGAIFDQYGDRASQQRRTFQNPWSTPEAFRSEYPIITTTTHAARNQLGKKGRLFDCLIIDESSQVDLVTGSLALTCARRAVIVGDCKQLPCVIEDDTKAASRAILSIHPVPPQFDFATQSLLSCVEACSIDGLIQAPRTLLKEHYRCHPDIIGFCNEQFYDNELIVMTEADPKTDREALMLMVDNGGNNDRKTDFNRIQSAMFFDELLPLLETEADTGDIGVVTPYRRQVLGMEQVAKRLGLSALEIDTVHKYQGREKDIIAFVAATNSLTRFADNSNLINVAISRAKNTLCLITSPQLLRGEGNIPTLARYIKYRSGQVIESSVQPAFPLLYPNRANDRHRFMRNRHKDIDDTYSEVQCEEYLVGVISELSETCRLSYCRNYPLKLLTSPNTMLTQEEAAFVSRSSHADFVVFRTVDKSVVLEIEVNGTQHYTAPRQQHRDELKRSILDKMGIDQVVIRTNEERNAAVRLIREGLLRGLESESAPATGCFVNITSDKGDETWTQ